MNWQILLTFPTHFHHSPMWLLCISFTSLKAICFQARKLSYWLIPLPEMSIVAVSAWEASLIFSFSIQIHILRVRLLPRKRAPWASSLSVRHFVLSLFLHQSASYKTSEAEDAGYLLGVSLGSVSAVLHPVWCLKRLIGLVQTFCPEARVSAFWQEIWRRKNDLGKYISVHCSLPLQENLRLSLPFIWGYGFSQSRLFFWLLSFWIQVTVPTCSLSASGQDNLCCYHSRVAVSCGSSSQLTSLWIALPEALWNYSDLCVPSVSHRISHWYSKERKCFLITNRLISYNLSEPCCVSDCSSTCSLP